MLPWCSASPKPKPPRSALLFEQEGELSAGIELRRLFPGITNGAKARELARVIAGWKPLPAKP